MACFCVSAGPARPFPHTRHLTVMLWTSVYCLIYRGRRATCHASHCSLWNKSPLASHGASKKQPKGVLGCHGGVWNTDGDTTARRVYWQTSRDHLEPTYQWGRWLAPLYSRMYYINNMTGCNSTDDGNTAHEPCTISMLHMYMCVPCRHLWQWPAPWPEPHCLQQRTPFGPLLLQGWPGPEGRSGSHRKWGVSCSHSIHPDLQCHAIA